MFRHIVLAVGAAVFLTSASFSAKEGARARDAILLPQGDIEAELFFAPKAGNQAEYSLFAPPQNLPQRRGARDDGRIVVAQSRKQLGQSIADNSVRVDELQEQVRQLTGQIEKLIFETQRLQEQIRIMQEDAEARFQALEGGNPPAQRSDANDPDAANHPSVEGLIESAEGGSDADLIGETAPADGGVPTIVAGNAGSPSSPQPLDIGAAIRAKGPAAGNATSGRTDGLPASGDPLLSQNGVASLGTLTISPNESADALYNLGYTQILNGQYDAAEESLSKFVELYPSHHLASSARYWLGETFYARGQFSDAVAEFSETYKTFLDSPKAPDSLLKLGLSLARLDERDAACATLAEMLSRFPDASRSLQIAAHDEQVRSNCS